MRRDTSVKKAAVFVIGALILLVFAVNTFGAGGGGDQPASEKSSAAGTDTSAGTSSKPATSLTTAASAPEGISLSQAGLAVIKTQGFNVYDGDTFHAFIRGKDEKVRVTGVDTPELDPAESGAVAARDFTASLVDGKSVWLVHETANPFDQYGRRLAYVWLVEPPATIEEAREKVGTATLNGRLLTSGHASVMKVEPNTTFANELAALVGRQAGFAAAFPSAPSSGSNIADIASNSSTGHGAIKGNISSSGEKIYHMPGQRYYDVTVIDTSRGERWFDTEEEAQAAGWRKSKV